jgi:hypothetical protein
MKCSSCGQVFAKHCDLHVLPCCPVYPRHNNPRLNRADVADPPARVNPETPASANGAAQEA